MRRLVIAAGLLLVISACSRTGNHERAYFSKQGTRYLVEMTATRRLMAHDPVSALLGRTYEESLTVELPRIDGEIDGSEIEPPPKRLRYTGRVVIKHGKMKIDLRYDDSTQHELPWNGDYTLLPRN